MAEEKKADSLGMRLIRAMMAMENPTKDTDGHNYKYATLDQVLEIVQPALFKESLGVIQVQEIVDGNSIQVTYLIDGLAPGLTLHRLDTRPVYIYENAQRTGSFETYMRRYANLCAFGLAPEDDDGAKTTKGEGKRKAQKPTSSAVETAKGRLWHDVTVHAEKAGIDARDEYRRLMVQAQNMQGCSNVDDLTADTIITVCELYEQEVFNV